MATVGNEIDWLVDPAMRASSGSTVASWGTVATNAQKAVPGGAIDFIAKGPDPWFATTVLMRAPDGHRRRVLVDSVTGEVKRVAGFGSVQRFLRDFHRRFMLPVAFGIPLVTAFGFLVLVSLTSGLITYKKFWRGFFVKPRWQNGRTAMGDLHRLGGLWSLWFVALMGVTSVWYFIEFLYPAAATLPPRSANKGAIMQPAGQQLDTLIAVAKSEHPGLEIQRVLYPFAGVSSIGVQGSAGTLLTTEKANSVWIDPVSGKPEFKVVGDQLSAYQRIAEMADPLHFGTWGGLPTKLIWFAFGIILTGLSVTGVLIFGLRLRDAAASTVANVAKGISYWFLPAAIVFAIAAALTPAVLSG